MEKYLDDLFIFENFSFSYPNQNKNQLQNINFSVKSGEFILICGKSGCGKSTFLRHFKSILTPVGTKTGEIFFKNQKIYDISSEKQCKNIGFVGQSPDNQIVTDKVWHELAFGLENLGVSEEEIRRKVAEIASFFGIQAWFHMKTSDLSGGQKQILNLASIMVMQPEILILDEPTSQLDPIASSEFLAILTKINREFSTTIILTEHKIEEVFSLANRVIIMKNGEILADNTPKNIAKLVQNDELDFILPISAQIWINFKDNDECPLTILEGKKWLNNFSKNNKLNKICKCKNDTENNNIVLKAEEIFFKYSENEQNIIKNLNFELKKGEIYGLLGANGVGKSTTLQILAGIKKAYYGEVKTEKKIGVLPQNPQSIFAKENVLDELIDVLDNFSINETIKDEKITNFANLCKITNLLDQHPYDLSGGEQQRLALCKILLLESEILFLDEPTKGFDAEFKEIFGEILIEMQKKGVTILLISHDIEFCAKFCNRCGLFFDGNIISENDTRDFFNNNNFYTTSANKMSRNILENAITTDDIIYACGGKIEKNEKKDDNYVEIKRNNAEKAKKMSKSRKYLSIFSGISSLLIMLKVINTTDFNEVFLNNNIIKNIEINVYLIISLIIFALTFFQKNEIISIKTKENKIRNTLAIFVVIFLIPITLYLGIEWFSGKKYYFISLLIIFECMLPFFLLFEKRKPQTREIVIISVLCALAISSRAMFFMLPQFKPVMAICIISGVAFGAETGFLVGAITMFVSNMMFAQGPWTPFQMFAMGIIGFFAGILFNNNRIKPSKISLSLFGIISSILIYGGILNPSYALIYAENIQLDIILTYYITGLPFDIIQGIATALFLWFFAPIMLKKLERIKEKYGLL